VTVTLPPDLADLLGRTGHSWPDADEDRIVAMADGWKGPHTRLDTLRGDHDDSVRSILADNRGEDVPAYGEWVAKYDALLLRLVEFCARAEALLLAIARTVLAAKKAILDALEALARAIEQAKRGIRQVPIIGDVVGTAIEEVIQPLLEAAREVIGEILDMIADLVVDLIVPRLVEFIELVKKTCAGPAQADQARDRGRLPDQPLR
jgi:hypothetical protein